jgi:hypothetical protein
MAAPSSCSLDKCYCCRSDEQRHSSSAADEKALPWMLVIEAKIDAAEGERQLKKYEEWIQT